MDHPETKSYRWPGENLDTSRPLGGTSSTSLECQALKGQTDKMCGKYTENECRNNAEESCDFIKHYVGKRLPFYARSQDWWLRTVQNFSY